MDCPRFRLWRKCLSLLFLRSDSLPVPMVTGDWHSPGCPLSFCHKKHHLTHRQTCISPPCWDLFSKGGDRRLAPYSIHLGPCTVIKKTSRFSVQFFRDRLYKSRLREGWARCSAFSPSSCEPVLAFPSPLLIVQVQKKLLRRPHFTEVFGLWKKKKYSWILW